MVRKRKLFSNFDPDDEPPFDDDNLDDDELIGGEDDDYGDEDDGGDFSIREADILDLCGSANARRGLALFLHGAVDECSFDGHAIRAQVTDDNGVADASYDFDELEYRCSGPAEGRGSDKGCAHVAALQYAWLRQPQSFDFANLGAALELYTRQPHIFDGSGLNPAFLAPIAALWENAPPALRKSISQLPAHGTPEQEAQFEAQLKALAEQAIGQDFADLLGRFTLEQLRAIAKRRHLPLRATAKAKAIAELIDQLRASPLPDAFSPEEEQLVRIENTLWGLELLPSHQTLLLDWQAHAGGNRARLEHALEGLQNAGVLFPCTGEGMGLHYHWSPFIRAGMLPLLQPNVALSPSKGPQAPASGQDASSVQRRSAEGGVPSASGQDASSVQRRSAEGGVPSASGQAPLPLLTLLDAVLTFAEREPLRLAARVVDPRLTGHQLVGSWPYVPEELEALAERRGVARQMPAVLTVPFQPYFAEETLDALGALAGEQKASSLQHRGAGDPSSSAGGLREYGAWAAAMLVQAGVIQTTPAGGRPASGARAVRAAIGTVRPAAKYFGVAESGLSRKAIGDGIRPAAQDIAFDTGVHATGSHVPAGETTVDPARVSAWHMLTPEQQFQQLWRLWCEGALAFGDFRVAFQDTEFIVRRSPYAPQFTPQTLAAEMGLARQFVARVLAMLSPQTWYAWPAFAACIRKLRSGFLYSFTGPEQWWIEHAPSAKRYVMSNPQHWDAAWLLLLQAILTGPLRWFGAIELNTDPLTAFRITPLGAWLFTEGRQGHVPVFAAAVAAEGPPFEWLDETSFRARATPDAMRALAPLRVYAEPSRELLTFRVSMPAIGHALAQGAAASSIVEAFATAGLPLAGAVQARIETLVARTGRLNLYERVTVLELGDDIALRELLATTALRAHIVHEFSPRLVVVRDEAVEALLAELVKKGHTPRLT